MRFSRIQVFCYVVNKNKDYKIKMNEGQPQCIHTSVLCPKRSMGLGTKWSKSRGASEVSARSQLPRCL